MVLKILAAVAVIAVIFAVIVALQPASFRISRSAAVSAPPQMVFEQVNDFHKWEAWNPWGKIDPAMKHGYDGPASGPGAVYSWAGNKEVGEGRMTIIESRPNDLVRVKLDFFKPFAATNMAEFTFKPEGNTTLVTWSMSGDKNFMAKAVHLFMNMDKMIGEQFDKGLASMKAIVETRAKQ
jgi:hypothetical protein